MWCLGSPGSDIIPLSNWLHDVERHGPSRSLSFLIYTTEEEKVGCLQSFPPPDVYSKSLLLLLKAWRREVRRSKGSLQLECRVFSEVRVSERILIKAKQALLSEDLRRVACSPWEVGTAE